MLSRLEKPLTLSIKSLLFFLLLGGLSSALGQQNAIVAYTADTNVSYSGYYNQAGGLNIGHEFYISSNMTVYSLGVYDSGGDGLLAPHSVTILSNIPMQDAYIPLGDCMVTVPAGTNAVLAGGFRFQPLNTPVVLTPGLYLIIAFQMNETNDVFSGSDDTGTNNSLNGSSFIFDHQTRYEYTSYTGPDFPSPGVEYPGYSYSPNNFGSASFTYTPGGVPNEFPPGAPTLSPTNTVVTAGQTVSLTASDSGTAPIGYQWYYGNGLAPIEGATNATLVLADIQTNQTSGNAGNYSVSAQNAYGGPVFSTMHATVTVNPGTPADAPVISPTNVVVAENQTVTLTATDDGTAPVSYQWYYGVVPSVITGATNSTLVLTGVQTNQTSGNAGNYSVTARNQFGGPVFSASQVTVTVNNTTPVNTPTLSPSNTVVNAGSTVILTANDAGALPITYQWYYGNALATISGATNASLVLSNVQANQTSGNAGNYYVSALNAYGGPVLSTNFAAVSVIATNFTPVTVPTISPSSVTAVAGQTVSLAASDNGTAPISYQWYYGNSALPGATNATLVLTNVQTNQTPGNAGNYMVSAQNSHSGQTYTSNSSVAQVTVMLNPGPVKIMPLGDSITDGFRGYGGYRAPLYQFLANVNFSFTFVGTQSDNSVSWLPYPDHEGISGSYINSVASGFPTWGPEFTPNVVLLLIGTNDYDNDDEGNDTYAQTATNRLDALVEEIATNQPTADLFVANLTLRTDNAEIESQIETTFNPYVPIIVSNHAAMGQHVYFVDMHSALGASDLSDGLHPNQTGYNKMAVVWYKAVTSVIPPPRLPAPSLNLTKTNATVTYLTVPGFEYVMQRATNVTTGPWLPLTTNVIPTNGVFQVIDGFGDLGGTAPSSVFYQPTLILY